MGSAQVSSAERQARSSSRVQNKTVNKHKIVPKMSLIKPSHIERAVKFVSSNSTKMKSETSPIVSSFRETGDKVTISEHQKTNKEDMLQKFPPKNILQKRFYSTDLDGGRLNWEGSPLKFKLCP